MENLEITFYGLTLIQVFKIMIFNAIYINGIVGATKKGYFLHAIKNFITNKFSLFGFVGKFIGDALIGCIKCMASIHGFYFLFGMLWINGINVLEIIQSWNILFYIFYWLSLSKMNLWVSYFESILLRIVTAPINFK